MSKRPDDLTPAALDGYHPIAFNEHLFSSPNWYAHELGSWLYNRGMPAPSDVRMGRGTIVHVRDMSFKRYEPSKGNEWGRLK